MAVDIRTPNSPFGQVEGSVIGAPPPVSEESQGPGYIGSFPGDYGVPGPVDRSGMSARGAEEFADVRVDTGLTLDALRAAGAGGYVRGDEWRPVNDPPQAIQDLQRRLYQAGLITPDDEFTIGYFDETTRNAYRALLERANGMGMDWSTSLETLRSNPIPGPVQPEPQLPSPSVSNPDDLRRAFKDVARKVWGTGNIPEAQLQQMISSFQGMQADAQVDQQMAATDNTGATTVGAPTAETFAEEELTAADPMRVDGHRVIDGLTEVFNMFGDGQ